MVGSTGSHCHVPSIRLRWVSWGLPVHPLLPGRASGAASLQSTTISKDQTRQEVRKSLGAVQSPGQMRNPLDKVGRLWMEDFLGM